MTPEELAELRLLRETLVVVAKAINDLSDTFRLQQQAERNRKF